MPETFKMGVVVPGSNKDHRSRSKKPFVKPLNLKELIGWIKKQNWDEYTKQELIRKASAYPCSGIKHFAENINLQVIKICEEREIIRKEKDEREKQNRTKTREEESSGKTDTNSIASEGLLSTPVA